ncbi:Arginine-hydroxylase NDUFAF5, mitochondrial [Nymphon striatum]|nr:Arginine-hydroxylase NDUFAF5, mitochondrial [Nymphon striatum]
MKLLMPFKLVSLMSMRNFPSRYCHLCLEKFSTSAAFFKYSPNPLSVFDRNAKRIQRDRAALNEDVELFDYLKDEIGFRLADRVFDVKRKFSVALDLGCGRGYVGKHLDNEAVEQLYQSEMSRPMLDQSRVSDQFPTYKLQTDEEVLPFRDHCLDLVISCLSLHWINDLPGLFKQINRVLEPDGVFLASFFGGDTLYQLRCSLQLAELEREGGFSPHISPFTEVQDLGNLLNYAGFTLPTLDTDEITINYPSMFELMNDLKGMGENNASRNRKAKLNKDSMLASASIYKELYGNKDGSIPATFQIVNLIAWKPDPSQPKPANRGSGTVSLKDIGNLSEILDDKNKNKKS